MTALLKVTPLSRGTPKQSLISFRVRRPAPCPNSACLWRANQLRAPMGLWGLLWQLNFSRAQTCFLLPVPHMLMPRLSLINVPNGNLYLKNFSGEKKINLSGEPYLRYNHYSKPASDSRIASHLGNSHNCSQDSTLWMYPGDKIIVIPVCQLIYKRVEEWEWLSSKAC